jgi:hypothetical protein
VLLEPVAVPALSMAGDAETFAKTETVFRDYIASVEGGNPEAIRTMVDFWFGHGAFDRMPAPMSAGLLQAAPANARDVRATFRETYSSEALGQLSMPVVTVVGERSPDLTQRIARAIAAHAPRGSVMPLAKASHGI